MAKIEGRDGLDDLVLRESKAEPFAQVWLKPGQSIEGRVMYTDDEGKDYDILDMRDALIAIKANTAPTAISLSLANRIRALYAIACQALPK